MATDETKASKSSASDESTSVSLTPLSTGWNCKKCGLSNDLSNWECMACYSPMRSSIQQRQKKNKNKKKSDINSQRQEKRRKLHAKEKMDSKDDDGNNNGNDNDDDDDGVGDDSKDSSETNKPTYQTAVLIPKTMTALIKEKDGKGFTLKTDYPVPMPAEDELLIKSFTVSICGSDMILYNWTKDAQTIAKLPFIPGHETAGLIVGRGSKCRMRMGERVAIENHFFCGECYQCKSDNRRDICANLNQFGHGKGTIYGGCCDFFTVKEKYCYRLRSNISWRNAALLEPLGVAHNACERCEINKKETVLVIGCGSIGCMAISVAKSMGAEKVIACDVIDDKLKIAQRMGADIVFNSKQVDLHDKIMELTDNVGVGRLIECSGYAPVVNECFGLVRKGGNVVLVGLPKAPLHVENVLQDIIFRSIQIRSIHGRRIFHTWQATEKLVKSGKVNLDPVVSQVLSLKDFEKGYEALASGNAMKIVFDLTKK